MSPLSRSRLRVCLVKYLEIVSMEQKSQLINLSALSGSFNTLTFTNLLRMFLKMTLVFLEVSEHREFHAPRRPSRDQWNDSSSPDLTILARHIEGHSRNQEQVHRVQQQYTFPTCHAIHHTGRPRVPLPAHLRRLLPP